MGIPKEVLESFNGLTKAQRKEVEALVSRHVAACKKQNVAVDDIGRVYQDAIFLVVRKENDLDRARPKDEPGWSYEQYRTPKDP